MVLWFRCGLWPLTDPNSNSSCCFWLCASVSSLALNLDFLLCKMEEVILVSGL